jgi:hypothetical protein
MNRTIVAVVVVLSGAGLIGWHTYLENVRFALVATQGDIAYEIDRKTGESWTIYPGKRKPNVGRHEDKAQYQNFPVEEQRKVIKLNVISEPEKELIDKLYSCLSGNIYNGSSWTVKEIIIAVRAKGKDGSIKWVRQFRDLLTIRSLSTESFSINITGDSEVGSLEWDLVRVSGVPPK